MRKDKCLFCGSRACKVRIVSSDKSYDEISCMRHKEKLREHAYKSIPKDMELTYKETTGSQQRGEEI